MAGGAQTLLNALTYACLDGLCNPSSICKTFGGALTELLLDCMLNFILHCKNFGDPGFSDNYKCVLAGRPRSFRRQGSV